MDVPGLVEGASEGRGLGNTFLDNWTNAELYQFIVGKKFSQPEAIR